MERLMIIFAVVGVIAALAAFATHGKALMQALFAHLSHIGGGGAPPVVPSQPVVLKIDGASIASTIAKAPETGGLKIAPPPVATDPRYTTAAPAQIAALGVPSNIVATLSDLSEFNALPENQKTFLKNHIVAWNTPAGLCPLHNAVVMVKDVYASNPVGTAGLI